MNRRGEAGDYRVDGMGWVFSEDGRTYVEDLVDTDWLAYTVMTEEAVYDVTFEVTINLKPRVDEAYYPTLGGRYLSGYSST